MTINWNINSVSLFFYGAIAALVLEHAWAWACVVACGMLLVTLQSIAVVLLSEKYRKWKNRTRVRITPMPKCGPYRT